MKKFYYKKNVPLDKSPMILRLERRHTMNVDEGAEKNPSQITMRTMSFSSVDQLPQNSAISKTKTREITKSLSEDVLNKGHLKKPSMVITETDLSSSLLYKIRKASMNSRDTPLKIPQQTSLSPVKLKDPKLKPIPVKSKSRSKKNSCLCYFAIMMAISVCTIGVLATITGILYKEIFADKNITSPLISQSSIEISNLIPESRLLGDDDFSKTYELRVSQTVQEYLERTENISDESGSKTSSINEDQSEGNHTVDFGKFMNVTDLNQFLDSRKAEIKFQDGDTILYEMNSSSSLEYVKSANGVKLGEFDNNGSKTENISRDFDKGLEEVIEEKIENLKTLIDLQSDKLKGLLLTNNEQERHPSLTTLTDDQLLENALNSIPNATVELVDKFRIVTENKESATFSSEESRSFDPKSKVLGILRNNESASLFPDGNGDEEENVESSDLNKFLTNNPDSQPGIQEVRSSSSSEDKDHKYLIDRREHDVESMLIVIDEPEEEMESVPEGNGEISSPLETSSFNPVLISSSVDSLLMAVKKSEEELKNDANENTKISPPLEIPGSDPRRRLSSLENRVGDPVSQVANQHSEERQISGNSERMKPLDMKVSLAEAMKHLQALDVNNKLLTSRIKPMQRKTQNTKQTKLGKNQQNKQDIAMEKMQYLQNLRLVLQESLLRT